MMVNSRLKYTIYKIILDTVSDLTRKYKIILETVSDLTRTKNTLVDVRPFPELNIVIITNTKFKVHWEL